MWMPPNGNFGLMPHHCGGLVKHYAADSADAWWPCLLTFWGQGYISTFFLSDNIFLRVNLWGYGAVVLSSVVLDNFVLWTWYKIYILKSLCRFNIDFAYIDPPRTYNSSFCEPPYQLEFTPARPMTSFLWARAPFFYKLQRQQKVAL
jgi:hypothetical protein